MKSKRALASRQEQGDQRVRALLSLNLLSVSNGNISEAGGLPAKIAGHCSG
jgi:hypothetical protein